MARLVTNASRKASEDLFFFFFFGSCFFGGSCILELDVIEPFFSISSSFSFPVPTLVDFSF